MFGMDLKWSLKYIVEQFLSFKFIKNKYFCFPSIIQKKFSC